MELKKMWSESVQELAGHSRAQTLINSAICLGISRLVQEDPTLGSTNKNAISGVLAGAGASLIYKAVSQKRIER